MDPLHEHFLGTFIGIVDVLRGNFIAGIALAIVDASPMQVEVDGQQANERKESQDYEEVKINNFPYITKFVHVDKTFSGRSTRDFLQISDL